MVETAVTPGLAVVAALRILAMAPTAVAVLAVGTLQAARVALAPPLHSIQAPLTPMAVAEVVALVMASRQVSAQPAGVLQALAQVQALHLAQISA